MKSFINVQEVIEIMNDIEDKNTFILELLNTINHAVETKNLKLIRDVLEEWEASAELNRIPDLAATVKRRYDSLVEAGLISKDN